MSNGKWRSPEKDPARQSSGETRSSSSRPSQLTAAFKDKRELKVLHSGDKVAGDHRDGRKVVNVVGLEVEAAPH